MTPLEHFRTEVIKTLAGTKLSEKELTSLLEKPPKGIDADIAFPCFTLAKRLKVAPNKIAGDLAKHATPKGLISRSEAAGPYVNFFADWDRLGILLLDEILKKKDRYGKGVKKKDKVMFEYPGPNTNKPLHLGHIRIGSLGEALANITAHAGFPVIRVDIINDRGIHIAKSMLAYKKFGRGKKPTKKSDHFVGDYYVLYAQKLEGKPGVEEELRTMLKQWEEGDPDVRALWKQMNSWALKGMRETYKRLGFRIDKPYYESDHYLEGVAIVHQGLKKGIFKKDEKGNIFADLQSDGLGKKVVLRGDGTSIYTTQDLALAKKRYRDYKMDRMIYVIGSEQLYNFKTLFKIFSLLKFPFAEECKHLPVGMVNLPSGKMKSREGKVVDADHLIDEVASLAKKEIARREKIPKKDHDHVAEAIALGAIKYFILKFDSVKDFTYFPEESLSFDGNTGPYLQYTHARACSLLKKATKGKPGPLKDKKELAILRHLLAFPETIQSAARDLRPHYLATYAFTLASLFNEFYQTVPVLKAEKERAARIALVQATQLVLNNCLTLLGIQAPEKM